MKLNRFVVLSFLLLALLATVVFAQQNDGEETTTVAEPTSTSASVPPTTTSEDKKEETSTTSSPPQETTTEKETTSEKSTSTESKEKPPTLTSSSTTEGSSTAASTTQTPTGATTLPPKPRLSTSFAYAKPTIPPTAGAPFMQKSSLPEGTFFIAVGAALGFLLFSIVAWRAIVAWSLHRSVKRAAAQANVVDSKAMLRPPQNGGPTGFYAAGVGSSVSLGDLGASRSGAAKQPANTSLFFSPTAGVGGNADRRSAYLPAGYYPSGNGSGSLGGPLNASQTHFHSSSVSSRNYGYNGRSGLGPSPPGSPLISPSKPPSRGGNGSPMLPALRGSESRTSLSLPPLPGQRAPSAYLEDLFENHQQAPGRY